MHWLCLLVALFACSCAGKVLMEVTFDLALQQESPTGYTASHTVGEYLNDPNLAWLRYFHTLVSGQPGNAPMRVAYMEFKDMKGWSTFENTNMERTHILYDLFWINWRRVLWQEAADTTLIPAKKRPEGKTGGFVWSFRFSLKETANANSFARWRENSVKRFAKELEHNDGFIERNSYTAGLFQERFQYMVMYEFKDMASLSKSIFENKVITDLLVEGRDTYLSSWATTILVPSADAQGGQIFKGAGAEQSRGTA